MATIVNSIGTAARDYSTPQAWEDARPADIVAAGNSYVGEMYNDSEFTGSLIVSGITTDATHTLTLRCAAGQSFRDHATRSTNRLAYDQSKGVGIRSTAAYSVVVQCDVPNVTIDGMQVINTASPSNALVFTAAALGSTAQNSIFQSKPGAGSAVVRLTDSSQKLVNSLVVVDTAAAAMGGILESAARAVNCTVVRPSNYTASGVAFNSVYGAAVVRNCAIFGFNTDSTGTYAADGHNVTDFTSAPGSTGNLVSKAYANQFQQSSNAGGVEDYRLKTGSDCINAGVTDATNVPSATDIISTARPQGTAWDVGAWEVAAGGGAYTLTATTASFAVTGNATALKAGRKLAASSASFALTGNNIGLKKGYALQAAQASFAVTGNAATLKADRRLSADPGSFTLTGANAALTYAPLAKVLTADVGSFVLTGNASALRADRRLSASAGSYVLTAQAANLLAARRMTAQAASYAITGTSAGLRAARRLMAAVAGYTLTGVDVGLVKSNQRALSAATASFAVTGIAASLKADRRLLAQAGQIVLTANSAGLARGYRFAAAAGAYTLSGQSAAFRRSYRLAAIQAQFAITANAANLIYTTSVVNLNFIAAKEHILTGRERSTVLVGRERSTVLVGKERILVIY